MLILHEDFLTDEVAESKEQRKKIRLEKELSAVTLTGTLFWVNWQQGQSVDYALERHLTGMGENQSLLPVDPLLKLERLPVECLWETISRTPATTHPS